MKTQGPKWPLSGIDAQNSILNPIGSGAPVSPGTVESNQSSLVVKPFSCPLSPMHPNIPICVFVQRGFMLGREGEGLLPTYPTYPYQIPTGLIHVLYGGHVLEIIEGQNISNMT